MPTVENSRGASGRWDAGPMDRITAHRNWGLHVAVAVTIALVAVIAVLAWSPWSTRWPAFAMLAVLAAAYLAYGWRGYESPRAAAGFVPLLVVAALVLPAVVPTTAFVQCMLFPVAWCQLDRVRARDPRVTRHRRRIRVGLQIATGPTGLVSTSSSRRSASSAPAPSACGSRASRSCPTNDDSSSTSSVRRRTPSPRRTVAPA